MKLHQIKSETVQCSKGDFDLDKREIVSRINLT